jgi:hypothetical protein
LQINYLVNRTVEDGFESGFVRAEIDNGGALRLLAADQPARLRSFGEARPYAAQDATPTAGNASTWRLVRTTAMRCGGSFHLQGLGLRFHFSRRISPRGERARSIFPRARVLARARRLARVNHHEQRRTGYFPILTEILGRPAGEPPALKVSSHASRPDRAASCRKK